MIIGITGTLGAGKTTVVEYLQDKGFVHYSVRDFLTRVLRERGQPVDRDGMVQVANELRSRYSPSYIVEKLYEEASEAGHDAVIESIRTPGEVEALRNHGDFLLLSIDADPRVRYDRVYQRGSETDNVSFEQFRRNEEREMQSTDPHKQNIQKCMDQADAHIENSGTLEKLYRNVEEVVTKP